MSKVHKYTMKEYLTDQELLRKNLIGEINKKDPDYINNPALFFRFIQTRAKMAGLDRITLENAGNEQRTNRKELSQSYLVKKIKERAHVFEKIEQTNA